MRITSNQCKKKYHCGGIYSSQFKSQLEFAVKLHECVRECSFEKPDEVVKFLSLTHNQNAGVREELLKSMKDSEGLNDILGYAHLAEGTQHSKSLSKAYLDTVKIPNSSVKVDAVIQKKNKHNSKFHGKCTGSKPRSQSEGGGNSHNCGTSHSPKHCPAYGKTCYNCNKKGHFKPLCRSHQHSQSGQDGREVRAKVDPGRSNMKFYHVIKLMTVTGMHVNRILSRLCTIKVFMEISLTFASMR